MRAAHRGQAWNAGSGQSVAVADVVRRLVSASGQDLEPDIRGERTARDDVDRQYLDSGAIARELGWSPAWSLDDGLRKTYAWYESALA